MARAEEGKRYHWQVEIPSTDHLIFRVAARAHVPGSNNARASSTVLLPNLSDKAVTLIHDSPNWLSVIKNLKPSDVIVLLTPVVVPVSRDPGDTADPFECFGRALALRHPKIRHVPYTNRNGITSTHVGFIKRATVVIFVLSDTSLSEEVGGSPQIEAAHVTQALADERPLLIVLTCNSQELPQFAENFPTIIKSRDYSKPILEMTASVIFGESVEVNPTSATPRPIARTIQSSRPAIVQSAQPKLWAVEQWNESRDINGVYELWTQTMDVRFALHPSTLSSLLRRPGYARHYVVRDETSGQVLGFCATYLSYVDQAGEKLIASLAILFVDDDHRQQGIGLSLHSHALDQLRRTRGVARLQLGTTFPRILYGPPHDMDLDQAWFSRRGWRMDREHPGQGLAVYDMLLNFEDWHYSLSGSQVQFRSCTQQDMPKVLEIVEEETTREQNMGWFDQYSRLINDVNVKDIVLAIESNSIVAVALTYTPSCGSPVAADLPWAGQVGSDVGGVTCICIRRTYFLPCSYVRYLLYIAAKRDAIMMSLLDACVSKLKQQGMKRMFLDSVSKGYDGFKQIGRLL